VEREPRRGEPRGGVLGATRTGTQNYDAAVTLRRVGHRSGTNRRYSPTSVGQPRTLSRTVVSVYTSRRKPRSPVRGASGSWRVVRLRRVREWGSVVAIPQIPFSATCR
jgi:hypothetical protein